MFTPSPEKFIIVIVIAMIILGPKRFPKAARSFAKNLREMKDGLSMEAKKKPEPPEPQPVAALPPPPPAPGE
jgi:Sec-independent protein translocase protein TatA